jgi:geranylgeranyl diphosphate synthase type I
LPPPDAFRRYRGALDEALASLLDRNLPPLPDSDLLGRMVRYHLGLGDAEGRPLAQSAGKGLRSTLCMLSCEAAGGDGRAAVPAALAVDLVHNFSLVHDDIQDRDPERRHRPSVWAVWGEAQAINAGDALAGLGRLAVLELESKGVPAETVVAAARALEAATLEMVRGQTLDIGFEERLDVSEAEYLAMVEGKSAALFDCAMRLGGLVGSADPAVAESLGRCGRGLGVAFQIRDDVLGVWGTEERTGKRAAVDIRNRKKSFPVVRALAGPRGDDLRRRYSKPELDDDDVAAVLAALEAADARVYCEDAARERLERALDGLSGAQLKAGPAAEMREVAEFLLERDY